MPFANNYNKSVASKVIANAKKDIATKDKMYDNPAAFVEQHSQQEYMNIQQPEVVGGSGNLAATSHDMGYEPKKVGGAKVNQARAKRVAKALGGEAPPMVVTTEAQPIIAKPKRVAVRKAKIAKGDGSATTKGDGSVRPTLPTTSGGGVMDGIKRQPQL